MVSAAVLGGVGRCRKVLSTRLAAGIEAVAQSPAGRRHFSSLSTRPVDISNSTKYSVFCATAFPQGRGPPLHCTGALQVGSSAPTGAACHGHRQLLLPPTEKRRVSGSFDRVHAQRREDVYPNVRNAAAQKSVSPCRNDLCSTPTQRAVPYGATHAGPGLLKIPAVSVATTAVKSNLVALSFPGRRLYSLRRCGPMAMQWNRKKCLWGMGLSRNGNCAKTLRPSGCDLYGVIFLLRVNVYLRRGRSFRPSVRSARPYLLCAFTPPACFSAYQLALSSGTFRSRCFCRGITLAALFGKVLRVHSGPRTRRGPTSANRYLYIFERGRCVR